MRSILFVFIAFLVSQCARQAQPGGGPKDVAPPELISSIPSNGQKNFKEKNIELTFDEYIKLKDPQEEIVITPSVGAKTKFIAKKNKIVIYPENQWKDSTTYSISFRSSVQDINESNPAEDLHIAFSTGSTIDSLSIFGSVTEIFKEKLPEKITVALYQSDTFDIFNHKPTYFTKTNKKGRFTIQNLKPGNYFIYAFDDKNKNFKADSKSERFGFLSKDIKIPENKDSVRIELIHVDARPIKITSVRNTNSISTIRFNKPLDSVYLKSENTPFIYTYGDNNSEVTVYKDFNKTDSLLINLQAFDSTQQVLDTGVYVKFEDSRKIEEKFKISEWQAAFNVESKTVTAQSSINKLLLSINKDSIYFQIDTITFLTLSPNDLKIDTLKKIIRLKKQLTLDIKEDTPNPVILFGKGAFTSIDNDSSKSRDVKINIPKTKTSGILSLEIKTLEKHFEVQLLTTTGKIVNTFRDQKKLTINYIDPAEYKIQIIVDSNNNHKWDAGNFYKKIEPEKVILYRNSENKYTFPIRANWEVGPLVITF